MTLSKKANPGISMLRLVLSYLVVTCHFYAVSADSFRYYLMHLAVPCFTFLSFYLMANKLDAPSFRMLANRVWRLFLPMCGWAFIYFAYYKILCYTGLSDKNVSIRDLIWQCFIGHSYNWSLWFISNQIMVLIIIWLVHLIFRSNVGRNVVLIILFGLCIISQCEGWQNILLPHLNLELSTVVARIPEVLPFACLGIFVKKAETIIGSTYKKITSNYKLYMAIILLFVPYILHEINVESVVGLGYGGWKNLFGALALSIAFVIMPMRNIKVVDFLSKYSMGLYCVHMMVGESYQIVLSYLGIEFGRTALDCFFIWAISLIIAIIIGQIPYVKKIVL